MQERSEAERRAIMAMPQCCYLAKGAKRPSHTTNTIKFDRIPFDPSNSIKRFDLCPFDQKNSTCLQPPVYDHRAKCFNKQGVVKSIDAPRSFTVDTGDRSIRRNQQLIRQSHGPLPTFSNETSDLYDLSSPCKEEEWKPELTPVEVIPVPSPPDKVPPQLIEKQVTTRSGRQVQKPARYR